MCKREIILGQSLFVCRMLCSEKCDQYIIARFVVNQLEYN